MADVGFASSGPFFSQMRNREVLRDISDSLFRGIHSTGGNIASQSDLYRPSATPEELVFYQHGWLHRLELARQSRLNQATPDNDVATDGEVRALLNSARSVRSPSNHPVAQLRRSRQATPNRRASVGGFHSARSTPDRDTNAAVPQVRRSHSSLGGTESEYGSEPDAIAIDSPGPSQELVMSTHDATRLHLSPRRDYREVSFNDSDIHYSAPSREAGSSTSNIDSLESTPSTSEPSTSALFSDVTPSLEGSTLLINYRKKLVLHTPESTMMSASKRRRIDETSQSGQSESIEPSIGLSAYSSNQLASVIGQLVAAHPELAQEVQELLPETTDLQVAEERLAYLKSAIFRAFPTQRWDNCDTFSFRRVRVPIDIFKKTCIDQGKQITASQNWGAVLQYATMAWKYVAMLPDWSNQSHNEAKTSCFRFLTAQCIFAVINGQFTTGELTDIRESLLRCRETSTEMAPCIRKIDRLLSSPPSNPVTSVPATSAMTSESAANSDTADTATADTATSDTGPTSLAAQL